MDYNINKGLRIARNLLLEINTIGLPVAIEFLDTISPQYTSDLISWELLVQEQLNVNYIEINIRIINAYWI